MQNYYTQNLTRNYSRRELITLRLTQAVIIFTGGVMFGYFWLAWVFGHI